MTILIHILYLVLWPIMDYLHLPLCRFKVQTQLLISNCRKIMLLFILFYFIFEILNFFWFLSLVTINHKVEDVAFSAMLSYEHNPAGTAIETKGSLSVILDDSDHIALEVYPAMTYHTFVEILWLFAMMLNIIATQLVLKICGSLMAPYSNQHKSVDNLWRI